MENGNEGLELYDYLLIFGIYGVGKCKVEFSVREFI